MQALLDFAKELAISAGALAREARAKQVTVKYKSSWDLVTDADVAIEKHIIGEIKRRYPDHQILAEESVSGDRYDYDFERPLWIIDPIDGTTNFARKHFQCAVCIAYMEREEVQAGVVHNPFQPETFWATKGGGAYLDGTKITVSGRDDLASALIGIGRPADRAADCSSFVQRVRTIYDNCLDLRRIGAGALDICWVGCGRLDAFWETLKPWDIAAALLVAKEAGAAVGHMQPPNKPLPADINGHELLVATPELYEKIRKLFTDN